MRLAFLGTSDFSVPSLRALVDAGHDVVTVVTQPDRPGNRGRPAPRPVADAAAELALPVRRPERLRRPEEVAALLELGLDAVVVAAYGQILPVTLLDGPRLGGINVHGSLLPRHRGAAPVAAAILAGDEEAGVSIMRMDAGIDTGPVWARRGEPLGPRVTAPQLADRLAHLGAELLIEVVARLEADPGWAPEPQDEALAGYAPRLSRADGVVDWAAQGAAEVDRRIRALQPWPGVMAPLAGVEVRLLEAEPVDAAAGSTPPGQVVAAMGEAVDVSTASGVLRVHRLQPPGRPAMTAAAYLRGRR